MAARATLHCLTGCAIGEVLGLVIGTGLGLSTGATIALAIALAFVFGYALTMRGVLRTCRVGVGTRSTWLSAFVVRFIRRGEPSGRWLGHCGPPGR